jgi:flagellar hook-associated protein FlgK
MLFDLSGKRRNVIRVIYAILAALFLGGFLFFGIGSDAPGGLGDLLGFGTNETASENPQFEQEIEDAEERLVANPKDEGALEELVRVRYQAGNDALEADEETGQVTLTPEAETQFSESTDAWERYLEVAKKKPSPDVAAIANQAYSVLLQFSDPQDISQIAEDAVSAAEIYAESNPGVGTYATLAQFAYFAGDTKTGDEAAARASEEVDGSQRQQLEKDMERVKEAAAQLDKQLAKQAEQGGEQEAFANPLQDTGVGSPFGGSATPAPAPAP